MVTLWVYKFRWREPKFQRFFYHATALYNEMLHLQKKSRVINRETWMLENEFDDIGKSVVDAIKKKATRTGYHRWLNDFHAWHEKWKVAISWFGLELFRRAAALIDGYEQALQWIDETKTRGTRADERIRDKLLNGNLLNSADIMRAFRYNEHARELMNSRAIDIHGRNSREMVNTFFKTIKRWRKTGGAGFTGRPRFPNYIRRKKTTGEYERHATLVYDDRSCTIEPRDGQLYLTFKQSRYFKKKYPNFEIDPIPIPFHRNIHHVYKQIRVKDLGLGYVSISIQYPINESKNDLDENKHVGIDLGSKTTLMAIVRDDIYEPKLVPAQPARNYNEFINLKIAKLQRELGGRNRSTNRMKRLREKRKRVLDTMFHRYTRWLVNYCVENKIGNVVIGYNKRWKDDVKKSGGLYQKDTRRQFVQLPYYQLIEKLTYKAKREGINVILVEEHYTSRCSALDVEPLPKQLENCDAKYNPATKLEWMGERVTRGEFKTATGTRIHADVNGALNVLRREIGDGFITTLREQPLVNPTKVNP